MFRGKKSKKLSAAISEAELEKLKLEIEQMKKRKWSESILPYATVLTSMIAVFGFIWSIYQFRSQQDKEYRQEMRKRFETKLEGLLQYTKEEKTAAASVGYLLTEIKPEISEAVEIYRNEIGATKEDAEKVENEAIRTISTYLAESAQIDCDFDKPRDAHFLFSSLGNWTDLAEFLKTEPSAVMNILDKHAVALGKLHLNKPAVVTKITYNSEKADFDIPDNDKEYVPVPIGHFLFLVENYVTLFKLIEDGNIKKEKAAVNFQAATCNPTLTKQVLGVNFGMKEKKEFARCLLK